MYLQSVYFNVVQSSLHLSRCLLFSFGLTSTYAMSHTVFPNLDTGPINANHLIMQMAQKDQTDHSGLPVILLPWMS